MIKDADGSVAGCHPTKSAAEKQLAALYANEGMMSDTLDGTEDRAKYSADDLARMAKNGQAMPDGSYPIGDVEDLRNAIRAVGRGSGSHDAIRRHIMKRARALGQTGLIPDNWMSDGSMQMASTDEADSAHVRAVDFTMEPSADGNILEGYAAVFNSPARIHEMGGEFDEVIAPGAFKRSLSAGTPVLMFEHGKHPLYGTLPIGKIDRVKEDARGLYIKANLHDNWLTEPLKDAVRSQAISGMSFRFSVPQGKDTWDNNGKIRLRTVNEARLYELGPVVFPAYSDTTVALRSLEAAVPNIHVVYDLGPELSPSDIPPIVERDNGTSNEPAPVSTSTEPAAPVDPDTVHSTSLTWDKRKQRARQLILEGNR